MSILIFKNTKMTSLSTLEMYLLEKGLSHKIISFTKGNSISDINKYDTLIILGGHMSANDENIYPFIRFEIEIAREFILSKKKILGICLGSQIMAKALGASVYKSKEKEIGWYDVNLSDHALNDDLLLTLATDPISNKIQNNYKVFQWHEDTFDLPDGAVNLSTSDICKNQVFKYNTNAYAIQYHFEISNDIINELIDFNRSTVNSTTILKATKMHLEEYNAKAYKFYDKFLNI